MKKILPITVSIITFLCMMSNAFAMESRVFDGAGLLTEEEISQLQEEIEAFIETYNMDLVLVTTLDSRSAGTTQDYADDFYDENGFGIGSTKDGILFLIDRTYGYNDVHMVTTGEAILIYDENRIDSIIDDVALQKNNGYYAMFSAFISSSASYAELGVAPSNTDYYIDSDGFMKRKRNFPFGMAFAISFAVSSVVVCILIHKNKMIKKAVTASAYLDQNTVQYSRKEDRFLTTHTSRVYIARDSSSSGGGGHGGGSSTHTGHSGVSHGGGGRRL